MNCKKFILLLALVSCCEQGSSFSTLDLLPGDDPYLPLLAGQGFNPLSWQLKGHCVDISKWQTQKENSHAQSVLYRMTQVKTLTELHSYLNISATASFSFSSLASASSSFSLLKDYKLKRNAYYLFIQARVNNQIELASDYYFNHFAKELLEKEDYENFTRQCGTQFVYGRRTGGEILAIIEINKEDTSSHEKILAEIGGFYGAWKGEASFHSDLKSLSSLGRIKVQFYRRGGKGLIPKISNLEELSLLFPKLLEASSGDSLTLELMTKEYFGVKPFIYKNEDKYLEERKKSLKKMSQQKDLFKQKKQDLEEILTEENWNFRFLDRRRIKFYLNKLDDSLNALELFAKKCANLYKKSCEPFLFSSEELSYHNILQESTCSESGVWMEDFGLCCKSPLILSCHLDADDGACLAYSFLEKEACW